MNGREELIKRLTLEASSVALQTHGEAETSGRQSVLVSPTEYSTVHCYKVWLESGTWVKKKLLFASVFSCVQRFVQTSRCALTVALFFFLPYDAVWQTSTSVWQAVTIAIATHHATILMAASCVAAMVDFQATEHRVMVCARESDDRKSLEIWRKDQEFLSFFFFLKKKKERSLIWWNGPDRNEFSIKSRVVELGPVDSSDSLQQREVNSLTPSICEQGYQKKQLNCPDLYFSCQCMC